MEGFIDWQKKRYSTADAEQFASAADDAVPTTLEEHDRRFHPDGFNPDTDRCTYRETLAEGDTVDIISTPDDGAMSDGRSQEELKERVQGGGTSGEAYILDARYRGLQDLADICSRIDRDEGGSVMDKSIEAARLKNVRELLALKAEAMSAVEAGADDATAKVEAYEAAAAERRRRLKEAVDELEREVSASIARVKQKLIAKPNPESATEAIAPYADAIKDVTEAIDNGDEVVEKAVGRLVRLINPRKARYTKDAKELVDTRRKFLEALEAVHIPSEDSPTEAWAAFRDAALYANVKGRNYVGAESAFSTARYILCEGCAEISEALTYDLNVRTEEEVEQDRQKMVEATRRLTAHVREQFGGGSDEEISAGIAAAMGERMVRDGCGAGGDTPFGADVLNGYEGLPLPMQAMFFMAVRGFAGRGNGKNCAYMNNGTVVLDTGMGGDYRASLLHESGHAVLNMFGIKVYAKVKSSQTEREQKVARMLYPIVAAAQKEAEAFAKATFGPKWKSICKAGKNLLLTGAQEGSLLHRTVITTAPEGMDDKRRKVVAPVGDILCAATGGRQFWGHSQKYYSCLHAPLHEVVANITELIGTSPSTAEAIFPETTKAVKRLIFGMEV